MYDKNLTLVNVNAAPTGNSHFDFSGFPIHAAPPVIAQAITEVWNIVKAPIPIIYASAMATVAVTCQSQIRVRRYNNLESPVSLFFFTVAESGERKTSADNFFTKCIINWQARKAEELKPAFLKFKSELEVWNARVSGLKSAIKKAMQKNEPTDQLAAAIDALIARKPVAPLMPNFILRDVTPEALGKNLSKWPSAIIAANEGGAILGSKTFSNVGLLNSCWDGAPIKVDRKSAECFDIPHPHLSLNLMVQPKTFSNFQAKNGHLARDNGFFARNQFSYPLSAQGRRIENGIPVEQKYLRLFEQRVDALLDNTLTKDFQFNTDYEILEFSHDAKKECLDFTNRVEGMLRVGDYLSDVKDAGSKLAENAARLAALFHYFSGQEGEISLETTRNAQTVIMWYAEQFKRYFGTMNQISQQQADAILLENWLWDQRAKSNVYYMIIPRNYMLKFCPNPLRSTFRLGQALTLLGLYGKIEEGHQDKAKVVKLLDYFYGPRPF